MDERTAELLAASITADLFHNGFGEHAGRLVLESAPAAGLRARDLGGWNEIAVRSLIARRLKLAAELLAVEAKEG